jgi:hypothetical protein
MFDLPEMQNLLRQKRLRWVGHALRRKDGHLSKDTVKQELAPKSSTWTACVLSDMEAHNIGGVVALEREANTRESFRKLTSAYTRYDVKRKSSSDARVAGWGRDNAVCAGGGGLQCESRRA